MQSLQQHIMLKKMQELQRQQQLHHLNDARQQNSLTKQSSGGQYPNMINGEPLHDTSSHMYMNWGQHGESPPSLQQLFSQEQGSMGTQVVQQQLDGSLYGTPVSNSRGNLNQYPHLQGITYDHGSALVKSVGNQSLKPTMNSSSFNTSFLGEQGFSNNEKNLIQGLNMGNLSANFQHANTHIKSASLLDSNWREETLTQINPQSSAKLDPLEEKILFGMNDSTWDPSFDGGSWSALMQSAVEEVSNNDTVPHEEWNMNLLTLNQPSNSVTNVKQHANNLDFGIQQPSFQFSSEVKDGVPQNFSHVSTHRALSIEGNKQVQSYDDVKGIDFTMKQKRNENIFHEHSESSNAPQGMGSNDTYNFVALQHVNTGHESRNNVPSNARVSQHVSSTHQESTKQGYQDLSNYRQVFNGQSNVYDNVSNSNMDFEKRHLPEFQGASVDILSRGNIGSNLSTSFDRENRHELCQNMDHLRKVSPTTHLGSLESHPLSRLSKVENSSYANQLCNQSSISRGFGLRLAPPHERVDNPNLLLSSQNSPKTGINLNSRQFNQEFAEKTPVQTQHVSNSPMEFQSLHAFFGPSSLMPTHTLRTSNEISLGPISESVQVTQPSNMSQQGEVLLKQHNVWTNIPIRHPSSDAGTHKDFSPKSSKFNAETTLLAMASQKLNDPNYQHDGLKISPFGASSTDHQGEGSINNEKQTLDMGPINSGYLGTPLHPQNINRAWQSNNQTPASSLNVLQTFGPSLQQSHQNHSLLQQVEVASKSNFDEKPVFGHATTMGKNQMGNLVNSVSQFQAGNESSLLNEARENNAMKANQPYLHNSSFAEMDNSNKTGNFQQSGNLKDGQMMMLQSDVNIAKADAEQFSLKAYHGLIVHNEQVSSAMANKMESAWPNAAPIPNGCSSDSAEQSVDARPKKRKTTTSEFLPWNTEVTQSSQRFQIFSMAEMEWAQAVNRLTEKVEQNTVLVEYVNPLIRSKKRLILTTQLMQQLLRPPPAAIFSLNATSCLDCVAYFVAKLSLGDACSLSCQKSDYKHPQDKNNMMVEKLRTSARTEDHYFSKAVEDFTARTMKLGIEFLRLDKKPSIIDLLVDFQDLDKISIINRFAKFHMRGQAYAAENLSTPNAPPKMFFQRYVTPFPMPRKLPDELPCLSL